jgi:hypothetical protein
MRGERERRDWRDERDGQNQGGARSVHVAPLALVVPLALERLAAFFSILPGISVSNRAKEYA